MYQKHDQKVLFSKNYDFWKADKRKKKANRNFRGASGCKKHAQQSFIPSYFKFFFMNFQVKIKGEFKGEL